MSLSIEWEHIEEPAVYQRNGREVYFDPIREIFILVDCKMKLNT